MKLMTVGAWVVLSIHGLHEYKGVTKQLAILAPDTPKLHTKQTNELSKAVGTIE